ncbi:MAG TPA: POTRA domain-containing protein [Burkholderiales bacterium]
MRVRRSSGAYAVALGIALAVCTGTPLAQAPRPQAPTPPRPAAPPAAAPAVPQPAAPIRPSAPPAAPQFEIQRFVVQGNTLLSQKDLEKILTPHAGKNRDFGDIQRALEALQDAYSSRGYNAVRVSLPEQDIRAGQVRLQVLEARMRRVRVQNNRFFSEKNVRASIPSLKEDRSPNTHAISQEAQLANENPAKQVSVALQAADDPGTVDATVRVTDEKPGRVSAYIDNTGTPSTGNYRTGVGYQHANVFDRDHVINAQAITSPDHVSDVKIFGVGYRVPIYGWGGTIDALAGYSSVNSGTVQGLFNVSGSGDVFGLRYTQLLGRMESYEHRAAFGWDYRAYKNDVVLEGTSGSVVPNITVRPVSLAYSGRFSQVGRDLSFNVSYSRNIPGGTNGSDADFAAQRTDATAKYSIARAGAVFSQLLPADLLVRVALNAQQTSDLLVPGEQFGMGGVDSVRGYYEREVANDIGQRASLEGYSPDFGSWFGGSWRARGLVFYDWAQGHDNDPVRGPKNKLGSYGVGARANQGKFLAFRLDAAKVTEDAGTRVKGNTRVNFAAAISF